MNCQVDCKEEFKEIFKRLNECEKDIVSCQNNKQYFEKYLDSFKLLFEKFENNNSEILKDFSLSIEKLEKNHNILLGVFMFFQILILPILFIIISKYF